MAQKAVADSKIHKMKIELEAQRQQSNALNQTWTAEISKDFLINKTHPLKLTRKEETLLGPQAASAWKSLLEMSSSPVYQKILNFSSVRSPKTHPIFAKTIIIRKGHGGAALKMGWSFLQMEEGEGFWYIMIYTKLLASKDQRH